MSGAPGAGKELKAVWSEHKKTFLLAGVGLAAALGLYARHKNTAGPGQTLGVPNANGTAVLDPVTGAPVATYTGAAQVDTTATDIAGNLDPMMVQQTNLLQQILAGINNPPKAAPGPPAKKQPKAPNNKVNEPPPAKKTTPIRRPAPGPYKQPASRSYTVARGDTLWGIARKENVPGGWQALWKANRGSISNPNLIYPGQKLSIP